MIGIINIIIFVYEIVVFDLGQLWMTTERTAQKKSARVREKS